MPEKCSPTCDRRLSAKCIFSKNSCGLMGSRIRRVALTREPWILERTGKTIPTYRILLRVQNLRCCSTAFENSNGFEVHGHCRHHIHCISHQTVRDGCNFSKTLRIASKSDFSSHVFHGVRFYVSKRHPVDFNKNSKFVTFCFMAQVPDCIHNLHLSTTSKKKNTHNLWNIWANCGISLVVLWILL